MMVIYTDDCIVASKGPRSHKDSNKELAKKFEGEVDEYVGVKVDRRSDRSLRLSQFHY